MKQVINSLQNKFFSYLEKSSCLSKRDHHTLWDIISVLVGASSFSFSSLFRSLEQRIGRNYFAKSLKKYTFIQRKVINELLIDVLKNIDHRIKRYLIVDDTLIKKSGKKLYGSLRWYNHCIGRQIQAFCLVTL